MISDSKTIQENKSVLPPSQDYKKWDLDFLMDFVVRSHHKYAKEKAMILTGLTAAVAERHGDQHPELKKLAYAAQLFFQDLVRHMEKEETALFPGIRIIGQAAEPAEPSEADDIREEDIREAVEMLSREHKISKEDLQHFRNLTNDYYLPEEACDSWTFMYGQLQEFEADWKHHLYIEKEFLFPKALKKAEKLLKA